MIERQTVDAKLLELQELTDPDRPITYGVVKPGPEDPETGVVFIRGGDIANGSINESELRTITQEVSRPYARTILRGGEMVMSLVGNPGEVALVPERLAGANLARQAGLIALRPEIYALYVKYYLMSPLGRAELFQRTQGAVQQVINLSDLKRVKVRLPSRPVQTQIADILSAYDDLIENNRRRIALLEEAAQMLYREWFDHYRFPGHEHVKIIDGVPDGWERRTLADVAADISYGYTESASRDVEGPKFLRITDIVDGPIKWGNVPRCPIAEEKLQRFLLLSEDVVVARTGATTGWARRVGRLSEPAVFASYLVRFRFNSRYRSELAATYMQSEAYKAFVRGNLGGAAQPNASAKVLASAPVVVPADALQLYFSENVAPMFQQIDALMDQNRKLAEARNLLLPRLMSGEIAV